MKKKRKISSANFKDSIPYAIILLINGKETEHAYTLYVRMYGIVENGRNILM